MRRGEKCASRIAREVRPKVLQRGGRRHAPGTHYWLTTLARAEAVAARPEAVEGCSILLLTMADRPRFPGSFPQGPNLGIARL
jgi:hypothetical protein